MDDFLRGYVIGSLYMIAAIAVGLVVLAVVL